MTWRALIRCCSVAVLFSNGARAASLNDKVQDQPVAPAPAAAPQKTDAAQQVVQAPASLSPTQQSAPEAFEKGRPSSDEEKATPKTAGSDEPKKDPLRPKAQKGRGIPLRVDVTSAFHYRDDEEATSAIFGGSPYASLSIRGARLWGDDWWRPGVWLGYRFEPGATRTIFVGRGSKGAQSWMMSHDVTAGCLVDVRAFRQQSFALFARLSGGVGLSVTTLQIHSLDDGHLYSETTRTLHATGFLDAGVVLFRRLELLVGVGGLAGWDASLELQQSDDELASDAQKIGPVHLSGLLLHTGVGLEF